MRFLPLLTSIAALGYALPQDSCATVTSEVVVPTTTATYSTPVVVTEHPTTAENLGTFTLVTTISSTTTIQTVTSTAAVCGKNGTVTVPFSTVTTYTTAGKAPSYRKRGLGLSPRDECTVTVTSTTTNGQTYTFVPNGQTSTFTEYTAFTQATITSTKSGATAYAIASATVTKHTKCGSITVKPTDWTTTKTLDSRCSPAAMTSAYSGYGIEWLSDTPAGGASYKAITDDSSSCCQLCAETYQCAASSWDIRSGECRLEFPVDSTTGNLNCGEGLLGYYDAGPDHPMSPGTGWFVAPLCGNVEFGAAQPDDGT